MLRSFVIYWFPFLAYAALIYGVSGSSGGVSLPFPGQYHIDKVIHALEYFVFAALFIRAYPAVLNKISYQEYLFLAMVVTLLYGLSDEIHQSLVPGRSVSLWDWMADAAGGTAAVLAGFRLHEARSL